MKQIDLFNNNEYLDNYIDTKIEDIFAERFANYSKYIIQDRALPDIRDGLKPVQRRILYAMYKDGNLFSRQYRKSAKTVGNVIGNYHPHGDSSVYEAMVRMSQSWKVNKQLIIMHGNNGSIDGDSAAAMRYTEAKLSEYSENLIKDIDLNTVAMVPNFDDTEFEPTVLPTLIPNLLVNGSSGISAGYATDIPPHNISEVLKAAIYLNKATGEVTTKELMKYVKGPDFPTGAIIQGKDQIIKAYETGKGKIVVKSKVEINGNEIIIKEIPYEVNKAVLLQKIELIKYEKKIDSIVEIIDQSAQDFIEIVIKCKKNTDMNIVLQYLYKNTDLQKNYNFNMIAINNKRPMQLSLKMVLEAFVNHRHDVVRKRSKFQLEKVDARLHIVEGIKLAIENLDKVIKIIRASKNRQDAIENIISEFKTSKLQAEAIVNMQLYRLTNTDITFLEDELAKLAQEKSSLEKILNNFDHLKQVVEDELKETLKKFKTERKSQIEDEIEKIELSKKDLIKEENVIVAISKNAYCKRVTLRSYAATDVHVKYLENDSLVDAKKVSTKDDIYIFFTDGTYVVMPVYEIDEHKWKDVGKHLSSFAKINDNVKIVNFYTAKEIKDKKIATITKEGYFNLIDAKDFISKKEKIKIVFQKVKDNDNVTSVQVVTEKHLLITYNNDEYVALDVDIIAIENIKRLGKKVSRLKKNQEVEHVKSFNENIVALTDKGGYIKLASNNLICDGKYHKLFENVKTNNHKLIEIFSDVLDEKIIDINISSDNIKMDINKLDETDESKKIKLIKRGLEIQDVIEKIEI